MNSPEPARSPDSPRSESARSSRSGGPVAARERHESRLLALPPAEQRRTIVELLRRGKSDAEIGSLFRLSHWQVRNLRYRLGIKKDRGGHVRLVAPSAEVAALGGGADRAAPSLGLHLSGRFEAGELARRLGALAGLCEATPGEYRVELNVQQYPSQLAPPQEGFGA